MAIESNALLQIRLVMDEILDSSADPGASGTVQAVVENANGGRRWANGGGSGQVERVYKRIRTLASGATDTYDVLAAGSLVTPGGQPIDLDEVKALCLHVVSGECKLVATGASFLGVFTAASEGIKLSAGQTVALDLGAAGIDSTTASQFAVTETSASASVEYRLAFIGAQ